MFKAILGSVFGFVGDWLNHKMKVKEKRQETELAIEVKKQEVLTAQATADINWDLIQAQGADKSWKDEYWTIVLSIPAILGFIPFFQDDILAGFMVLERMPDYYVYALLTAIAAAFGRSELIKWVKGVKK